MPSAEVSALRTQNASFCWAKRDFVSCVCHPNCQLFAVGWLWSYLAVLALGSIRILLYISFLLLSVDVGRNVAEMRRLLDARRNRAA